MSDRAWRWKLVPMGWAATVPAIAVVALAAASPRQALESAVVGTGSPASCTNAALTAALVTGGSVTFNCGPSPITITVASSGTIAANTSIDGGNLITLSGSVLTVNAGVTLAVANLTMTLR